MIGAPSLWKRRSRPRQPHDLHALPCIGYSLLPNAAEPWRLRIGKRQVAFAIQPRFTSNDLETCMHAAVQGVGLFCVVRSVAAPYLEAHQLETVLGANAARIPGMSLYYPSRTQTLPKLRAFVAFAKQRMA